MILLGHPSKGKINEFLSTQLRQAFTYHEVGMTKEATTAPPGYTLDHNRVWLGEGSLVFEQAVTALRKWHQFNLGWMNVCSADTPIETGSVVGLLTSWSSCWLLFACRIVYVLNEVNPLHRQFGFAYGTLPGHPECGEERFVVEWDASDNSVWYDILAISHPGHFLIKCAYPLARFIQRRFVKDSQSRMLAATVGANAH